MSPLGGSELEIDSPGQRGKLRALLDTQQRVLELVATDHPLQEVLDTLCLEVERLEPGTLCSVMLLESDCLRLLAAPSAQPELGRVLQRLELDQGSCGTSAVTGEMVIVTDTLADPRWANLREVARRTSVGACWSVPILSKKREVLGTFAISHFENAAPDDEQRAILETSAHIASIAIRRDRIERSLRLTEATYRTIYESVNDAIFVHDIETGEIVDVNPRMCEMMGCTREQALQMRVGDFSVGETFNDESALHRIRLAAGGRPQIFEWLNKRLDGTTLWVEVNLKRATIGGEDRVLAVVRDISERKTAEQALLESEATMRSIMDSSPDFVMLLDLEVRIRFMNRTTPEHKIENVIGRDVYSFVEERFWPVMKACFERVRQTGRQDSYEVEYVSPHQGRIVFESRVAPVLHDDTIVGFSVLASDITARREAERAIVESEERFRQLTESLDDVFWLTDWTQRRVMYVSPSYERVYGLTCESLYSDARSWSGPIHPDDLERVKAAFYTGAEQGEYDVEYRILRPDGEIRWIHDKAFPIIDQSGAVVRMAGVSKDITQRKRSEAELVRRGEAERILRCELDHRVRNNLASLMTLIDMSERAASDLPGFAAAIKGRVNAMATIHSFLSRTSWSDVSLREMVAALTPPGSIGAVECQGERVMVPAYQCNSLAVVLHELLHNSMKYGALGNRGSEVLLSWSVEQADGALRLRLHWKERVATPIKQPPTLGVGTSLIEGLVKWDLAGDVKFGFPPEGADHVITVVLSSA